MSAQRLPRGRKRAAERWERLDGEDRAGNKRGEAAKEVCNRTSDARCAGVPNLGSIGRELEDFLPQLCGGSCGQARKVDGVGQIANLQGTNAHEEGVS